MNLNLVNRNVKDDILTLFIGMLVFAALPNIPFFKNHIATAPYMWLGIAILLVIFKKKIENIIP